MNYHNHQTEMSDYTISKFSIVSGDASGLHLRKNAVEIEVGKYDYLKLDQKEQIVTTYSLTSKFGTEIPKTAVFLITGTLDGPSVCAADSHNRLPTRNDDRAVTQSVVQIPLAAALDVTA